jgi:hypothetical protein
VYIVVYIELKTYIHFSLDTHVKTSHVNHVSSIWARMLMLNPVSLLTSIRLDKVWPTWVNIVQDSENKRMEITYRSKHSYGYALLWQFMSLFINSYYYYMNCEKTWNGRQYKGAAYNVWFKITINRNECA